MLPFAWLSLVAFYVWCSAGIVHDVPELDVAIANGERDCTTSTTIGLWDIEALF